MDDAILVYKTPTLRYFSLFRQMLMIQFDQMDHVEQKATCEFDMNMMFKTHAARVIQKKLSYALSKLNVMFDDNDSTLRTVTRYLGKIHKNVQRAIHKIKLGIIKPTIAQLTNIKAFSILYDRFQLLKQTITPMYDPNFTLGY